MTNDDSDVGAAAAGARPYGVPPPGFRLPDATRLGRIRLQVADLGRSLAYYEDVLGLRTLASGARHAALGPQDGRTVILELHEQPGASPPPRRGRLGLFHFAILLPDRPALGRFVTHLAARGEPAGASDHLVSEALYLNDPDGHGIEVYADRPRASWRSRERELLMDTRPLDLKSLVAAAGGQPWDGMPPGTILGHMHLHVGDLSEAAAFYHTALGFDAVVWSYPGALFLSAGGYHHHLGLNTWAGPGATPPQPDDARLLEWTILVPDGAQAEAAARSLASAGYDVTPSGSGWLAPDPWGTVLRIGVEEEQSDTVKQRTE